MSWRAAARKRAQPSASVRFTLGHRTLELVGLPADAIVSQSQVKAGLHCLDQVGERLLYNGQPVNLPLLYDRQRHLTKNWNELVISVQVVIALQSDLGLPAD